MILQADIILSNVNDGKPGENGKSGVSLFKSYAFKSPYRDRAFFGESRSVRC